jgi:hypothetical protein
MQVCEGKIFIKKKSLVDQRFITSHLQDTCLNFYIHSFFPLFSTPRLGIQNREKKNRCAALGRRQNDFSLLNETLDRLLVEV